MAMSTRKVALRLCSRFFAGRGLATGDTETEVCYMMGASGVIPISGSKFVPLKDFMKSTPFLSVIPRMSFCAKGGRTYELLDPIRRLLKSGSISASMISSAKVSILNPFQHGNVGVHSDLGVIVFKQLTVTTQDKLAFGELCEKYVLFLEELVKNAHGPESLRHAPLDLQRYWDDLRAPKITDVSAIDHPTTMSDMVYADVCVEVYRILIKQGSVWKGKYISKVLEELGKVYPDAVNTVMKDGLLVAFIPNRIRKHKKYRPWKFPFETFSNIPVSNAVTKKPRHKKPKSKKGQGPVSPTNTKKGKEQEPEFPTKNDHIGTWVVEVIRHSAIHSVEPEVNKAVRSNCMFTGILTRVMVLKGVRRKFGNYLADVFVALKKHGDAKYNQLHVRERCTISPIYQSAVADQVKIVSTSFVKEQDSL